MVGSYRIRARPSTDSRPIAALRAGGQREDGRARFAGGAAGAGRGTGVTFGYMNR